MNALERFGCAAGLLVVWVLATFSVVQEPPNMVSTQGRGFVVG